MTEDVGNKRPPVHSRFKKGQSGNPRGRPRGSLNLKTDLLAELAEAIVVTEGGLKRKITKQRAFVKATIAKAIQGDGRAANALIGMIAKMITPDAVDPPPTTDLSKADQEILEAFLARHAKREDPSDGQ
jgi:replication-associated recombination protein RarA